MKQIYAANQRFRPTEILLGLITMSWGMSGWFGQGALYYMLETSQNNLVWGALLVLGGFLMVVASSVESVLGDENLPDDRLLLSARIRAFASLLSGLCWIHALKVVIGAESSDAVIVLSMTAPVAIVFCARVFVENAKVKYALDPSFKSSRLKHRR